MEKNYEEMTGTEIMSLCVEREISNQGTRAELIEKLIAFDNGETPIVENTEELNEETIKEESSEEIKVD